MNKCDLVPKANVEAWLRHLRKQLPTLAFKASTQEQKTKLVSRVGARRSSEHSQREEDSAIEGRAGSDLSTVSSKCLGGDLVCKLLANYCRFLCLR